MAKQDSHPYYYLFFLLGHIILHVFLCIFQYYYVIPKLSDFILLLGLSVINIKNYEFIILTYWFIINNSVISWNNHNSLLYKRLKSLSLGYYLVQIENRSIYVIYKRVQKQRIQ